jgi:hypothetical protein
MFQVDFQAHLCISPILLRKQIALAHGKHPEESGVHSFDQEVRV